MGIPVPANDLPGAVVPDDDLPVNDGIRNPVADSNKRSAELAKANAYSKQRQHEARMQNDPYYRTAQEQGPVRNALSAMGGVFHGLGNLGPRQIIGKDKPGEYKDWQASMEGLNSTGGGKVGSFLGYGLPVAATAPITGAGVTGAAITSGLESFLDPADTTAQRAWKTALGATTGAAGQKVANVVGNTATNARATRQLRSYPGGETVRDKTLKNTLDLGYKLPPSAAGKQSILESVGGQIKTQQTMSDFNQNITDNLVRKELADAGRFGYQVTPTTPLTSETLKNIRTAAGKPYEEIKKLGTIQLVIGKTKAGNPIAKGFDATKAVDDIKQLRHDGYSQLSSARASGDPAALKEAKRLLDEARKLEDNLETGLQGMGQKRLLEDLRKARQLIAKSYNIQDATSDSVGRVDARDIGKLYEMGEKGMGPRLTGSLADVGKAGSAFRESMGLRGFDTPRYSALDFAVGGNNAANATTPAGMLMGGIPLLRGPARSKLMSPAAQAKLMPSNTPPNMALRAAPWLLDYTPNLPGIGPYPLSRTLPPSLLTGGLLIDSTE